MRWLIGKDLRILWRSPLLVALLVIYPLAISVLIGVALSRPPAKPTVAVYNEVAKSDDTIEIGSTGVKPKQFTDKFFKQVNGVKVDSKEEAIEKVESGEALAAIIVPSDTVAKLSTGIQQPELEVYYNADDPVKTELVEQTITSQLAKANAALTKQFIKVASQYIGLIVDGGSFQVFNQQFDVLGLKHSLEIISQAVDDLPADSKVKPELERVEKFARIAVENLDLSDNLLAAVGEPIKLKQVLVKGEKTPLDQFAVAVAVTISLLFVTVLLAAGLLALEREENAFTRLVRGLVGKTKLLVSKITLATICASVVALLLLCGIGVFFSLDWSRAPLWIAAVVAGALGFAALGTAIGAVAREVRAASLLAFLLALPIAFLALVPSGAVSSGLYTVISVINAAFPFKPALDLINVGLNGGEPGFVLPLVHLLVLALVFGGIGRIALRRFA